MKRACCLYLMLHGMFLAASSQEYSTLLSDGSEAELMPSNEQDLTSAILQASTTSFDLEVPKVTWYGRKTLSKKAAQIILCLHADKTKNSEYDRLNAQRELLASIKEKLCNSEDLCVAHLNHLLAEAIADKGAQLKIESDGPCHCNFSISLGKDSWHAYATFDKQGCNLELYKNKGKVRKKK